MCMRPRPGSVDVCLLLSMTQILAQVQKLTGFIVSRSLAVALAVLDVCSHAVSWCLLLVTEELLQCGKAHLGHGVYK